MTGEPKGATEDFIERTGAKYAYGYQTSGDLARRLGVSGIPSAFLVSPAGQIVWQGHPAGLTDSVIAKHLTGALKRPLWEGGKSTRSARKLIASGKLAKALAALAKKDDDEARALSAELTALIELELATMKERLELGDYLEASGMAERLEKELKGHPGEEAAAGVLDAIRSDKDKRAVLAAQEDLRDIMEGVDSPRDAKKALPLVNEIRREHAGTYAEKQAEELADMLRQMAG